MRRKRNITDHSGPFMRKECLSAEVVDIEMEGVIASVVENRAREVCICWFSFAQPHTLSVKIVLNGHSYNETLLELQDLSLMEVLLHDGARGSILSVRICNEFRDKVKVLFISRQYFNQDTGAEFLNKILVTGVDTDLTAKYTFLSGSHCLLRYVESFSTFHFCTRSIRVEFCNECDKYLMIDRRTAMSLELVKNTLSGNSNNSLFDVVNYTKTTVGARLLRSNILRPLADIGAINSRQAVVDNLLREGESYAEIVTSLSSYPDLDRLLGGIVFVPVHAKGIKGVKTGLDTLIFLKASLVTSKFLATTVQSLRQSDRSARLLSTIHSSLWSVELEELLESINDTLVDHVGSTAKSPNQLRHAECFAIKPGVDGMLDVARKTFIQTIEEIHKMTESYMRYLGLEVRIAYSLSRGYYLIIPANSNTADALPSVFIQPVLNRRTISCTTFEVLCLSDRATESINQTITITDKLIQNLLEEVRKRIFFVYAMVDSLALLDMLASCAEMVTMGSQSFIAPELCEKTPLVIKEGRHPILSSLRAHNYVPNSTILAREKRVQIIFGPNGSGKSILIKQIALIIILAQIGYYVPAKAAMIPLRKRVLSRIGTADELENNMSTFALETREVSYLLNSASESCFIAVDELGRGTSNIEGISLAFAVLESLVQTKSIVFYVTHYPQVAQFAFIYPSVQNVHMKVVLQEELMEPNDIAPCGIKFLHQSVEGSLNWLIDYGIIIAKLCLLPDKVLEKARKKRVKLSKFHELTVVQKEKDTTEYSNALISILACKIVRIFDDFPDDVGRTSRRNLLHALDIALLPNLPSVKSILIR